MLAGGSVGAMTSTADDPAYEMTFGSTSEPVPVPRWDAMEQLHREILLLTDRVNYLVGSRESMGKQLQERESAFTELRLENGVLRTQIALMTEELERMRLREKLQEQIKRESR